MRNTFRPGQGEQSARLVFFFRRGQAEGRSFPPRNDAERKAINLFSAAPQACRVAFLQCGEAQTDVRPGPAAQEVTLFRQGGKAGGQGQQRHVQGRSAQNHMGQTGMQRQARHAFAVRGDDKAFVFFPRGVQCEQGTLRGCQCGGRRRRKPGQVFRLRPPSKNVQQQRGEVGVLDFRAGMGKKNFSRMPQAAAYAGFGTPGPPGALLRSGLRHALRRQPAHARGGVEAGYAGQPCVYHHTHTLNSQAAFRQSRGQDNLAPAGRGRSDGRILRGRRKSPG